MSMSLKQEEVKVLSILLLKIPVTLLSDDLCLKTGQRNSLPSRWIRITMRMSPTVTLTSLSLLITVTLEVNSHHHVEIKLEAAYKVAKQDNSSQVAQIALLCFGDLCD